MTLTKQEKRELLVLRAMRLGDMSIEDAEKFDTLVCNVLGIDSEKEPPIFILSTL